VNRPVEASHVAGPTEIKDDGPSRPVIGVEPSSEPIEVALEFSYTPPPGMKEFARTVLTANPANRVVLGAGEPLSTADLEREWDNLYGSRRDGPKPAMVSLISSVVGSLRRPSRTHGYRRFLFVYVDESIGDSIAATGGGLNYIDVVDALKASGTQLWVLAMPDLGDAPVTDLRSSIWHEAVADSGGLRRLDPASPAGTTAELARIAKLMTSEYRVSYSRPGEAKSSPKIEVKVNRPNVKITQPKWPRD
jgi:hypothetical protein